MNVRELHYITYLDNLPSIMRIGILSHQLASELNPRSFANQDVQNRRALRKVAGKPLHSFVNLYLNARNPALYAVIMKNGCRELCVLRVSLAVFDRPGVYVADGNASDKETSFFKGRQGLEKVNWEILLAERWSFRGESNEVCEEGYHIVYDEDEDEEYKERKRIKCAEVLVPHWVEPEYIVGAYVSCQATKQKLEELVPGLMVTIDRHMFFDWG